MLDYFHLTSSVSHLEFRVGGSEALDDIVDTLSLKSSDWGVMRNLL